MIEPLWYKRLNYETVWMSRHEIQNITYEAIAQLVTIKGELGILPSSICKAILGTVEETKFLLSQMEKSLDCDGKLSLDLRDSVRKYNRKMLAYSNDQIIPLPRPFGGRWFDDFTVPINMIKELET